MIVAGLNDVLMGNGASIGKQITKTVKELGVTSHNVQIAVLRGVRSSGQEWPYRAGSGSSQ